MFGVLSSLPSPFRRQKICCFHFGRCGSTLLGNMLASHPKLDWRGELFHSFHERDDKSETIDPCATLEQELRKSRKRHFGYEIKFQHLDENGLNINLENYLANIQRLGFHKFVLLVRRNYLRQAISVARGQLTGTWHRKSTESNPEFAPIHLNVARISLGGKSRPMVECFEFLDQVYSRTKETFNRLRLDLLEMFYEDHLEHDPFAGYKLALSHFGLPYVETKVSVKKLEVRPVSDIVTNYEEIRVRLANTHYKWMCDS